mmetsp:Transcript_4765/g.14140  ORF Transcript_4765/g.14140 Transcript_4765/m.14140 type:complete len:102 (-) Transcript_4765:188-493(-)
MAGQRPQSLRGHVWCSMYHYKKLNSTQGWSKSKTSYIPSSAQEKRLFDALGANDTDNDDVDYSHTVYYLLLIAQSSSRVNVMLVRKSPHTKPNLNQVTMGE